MTKSKKWYDLLEEGDGLKKSGAYADAIKKYKESLKAGVGVDTSDIDDLKILKKFNGINKGLGEIQNLLAFESIGICYAELEKHGLAIEWFTKLLKINSSNGRALYNIGLCNKKMANYKVAIEFFTKSEKVKNQKTSVAPYKILSQLGQSYLFSGEIWKAIRALKRVVKAKKADYFVYISLGDAYHKLEKYAESLECFKMALKKIPGDDYALGYIGHLYNKIGDQKKAIKYTEMALEKKPNDIYHLSNMACFYSVLNDKKQAISYLKKATKAGRKDYKTLVADPDFDNIRDSKEFKTVIEAMAGKKVKVSRPGAKSVPEKKKALEKKAEKVSKKKVSVKTSAKAKYSATAGNPYLIQAEKKESQKKYTEAAELYENSFRKGEFHIKPTLEVNIRLLKQLKQYLKKSKESHAILVHGAAARCYTKAKNARKARLSFKKMTSVVYRDMPYHPVAKVLLEMGELEGAEGVLKYALDDYSVKDKPKYMNKIKKLAAEIHLKKGDYWKAVRLSKGVISFKKSDAEAYYKLAASYAGLKMPEQCLEALEKAKEYGWNEKSKIKKDPYLKKMLTRKAFKEFLKTK